MKRAFPVLLAASRLFAQDAPIRVDVQQVVVPVIVSDKNGHRVSGLKESDFRILEDGVPQKIVSFSGGPGTSGTYVICVDTLHTSPASAARLRDTLEKLFEGAKPGDAQYVLIGIGRQLQVLQTATNNPLAILTKLRSPGYQQHFGGPDGAALEAQLNRLRTRMDEFCRRCTCSSRQAPSGCGGEINTIKQSVDTEAEQWSPLTKALLDQFRGVVDELAKIPTGRTLIFVSDGFTTDSRHDFYRVVSAYLPGSSEFQVPDTSDATLAATLKTAADKNIRVDTLDTHVAAASLANAGGASSSPVSTLGQPRRNDPGLRGSTLGGSSIQPLPASAATNRNMEQLATMTGGTYAHTSDLLKEFRNALADGREYYVLTYTPQNTAQDGSFRRIAVETADRKLTLRAKSGYWAPAAAAQ